MITKFKIFENINDEITYLEFYRIPSFSPKLDIALEKLDKIGCDITKGQINLKSNIKYIYIGKKIVFQNRIMFTNWFVTDLKTINSYKGYKGYYINISKKEVEEYNMRQIAKKYNI